MLRFLSLVSLFATVNASQVARDKALRLIQQFNPDTPIPLELRRAGWELCAACEIVVGIVEQVALIEGTNGLDKLEEACRDIDDIILQPLCLFVLDLVRDALAAVAAGLAPFDACSSVGLCDDENSRLFDIWPPPQIPISSLRPGQERKHFDVISEPLKQKMYQIPGEKDFDFLEDLEQLLLFLLDTDGYSERVFERLRPLVDFDGDYFGIMQAFRGTNWRGKDCNDIPFLGRNIYPGRAFGGSQNPNTDHNCNGISGRNPDGTAWEQQLCAASSPMGIAVLGDSAAAHFGIPRAWVDPFQVSIGAFDVLLHVGGNELDWPQCSLTTGYVTNSSNTDCPPSLLPLDSLYLRLRERNLCNHRDYQNLGVNGARSVHLRADGKLTQRLQRSNSRDNPLLVFLSVIGNDVCNSRQGTDSMTPPEEFRDNILSGLFALDGKLPPGSHVVFVPLANGLFLHEALDGQTHPFGVTYNRFFDWLNSVEQNPCRGWLNNNATERAETQERADQLNAVYAEILVTHLDAFRNFDINSVSANYIETAMNRWVQAGGQLKDCIEAVDGFHPSTTGLSLMAEVMWEDIMRNFPHVLGPENPNNDRILELFGEGRH